MLSPCSKAANNPAVSTAAAQRRRQRHRNVGDQVYRASAQKLGRWAVLHFNLGCQLFLNFYRQLCAVQELAWSVTVNRYPAEHTVGLIAGRLVGCKAPARALARHDPTSFKSRNVACYANLGNRCIGRKNLGRERAAVGMQ